jgi:glycosyltransferase involved in cell wall biosynthesis
MRIAFYIGDISLGSGGLYTYSNAALRILTKESTISQIVVLGSKQAFNDLKIESNNNSKIVFIEDIVLSHRIKKKIKGISNVFFDLSDLKNTLSSVFRRVAFFVDPYVKLIDSLHVDLFYVPGQCSPCYGIKVPIIVTMHDIQEIKFPQYFSPKDRLIRALLSKRALELSDHVIVSFQHVREDIINYFAVPPDKVSVCPIPLAAEWLHYVIPKEKKYLKKKYSLIEEFILYPAHTWLHKNHKNLLHAVSILKKQGFILNLICTGGIIEKNFKVLQGEIDYLNIQDQVRFLGVVPVEDLVGLYKMTKLVVIPSLNEAGSGPLIEAMHYGAPVICSNVTSLPETIGDREFTFNPNAPEEMAEKIKQGYYDDTYRGKNIENSKKKIEEYKTKDYLKCMIDIYHKVISKRLSKCL